MDLVRTTKRGPPPRSVNATQITEYVDNAYLHFVHVHVQIAVCILGGWAGRWCWVASSAGGFLLLLHIVRQGPAVLAACAGWVG